MNRKASVLLFSFIIVCTLSWTEQAFSLYTMRMMFPSVVEKIPSLRVYFAGNKIATQADNINKNIFFETPGHMKNELYLLITAKKIEWAVQNGIITSLKINSPDLNSYKMYKLTPEKEHNRFDERVVGWHSEPCTMDPSGHIPDNTIIILFDARLIDGIAESTKNGFELPPISVCDNIFSIIPSEEQLHVMVEAILLESINSNTFHKKVTQCIKRQPHEKTTSITIVT